MKLTLTALILAVGLLRADIVRNEIATKGDWTIASFTENGKPAGAEMLRTFPSKHEVHLRLRLAKDGSVQLDAMNSELGLGDAKTQPTELRVDHLDAKPLWSGNGTAVEDADGLGWLRINLGKGGDGEVTESVLKAMMEGGKTLNLAIGIGKNATKWKFDLTGTKAAYNAMWDANQKATDDAEHKDKNSAGAGADALASGLVEHEYARPGDWAVHYYTKGPKKLASASMIRFFDNTSTLRMSIDATHFHLDVAGDRKAIETAAGKKGKAVPVSIVLSELDDGNGLSENANLIDDEGDKWLRISQPLDEPGGLQDLIRNGKRMQIIFSKNAKWSFDLKGSLAAWQKVDECLKKFGPITK